MESVIEQLFQSVWDLVCDRIDPECKDEFQEAVLKKLKDFVTEDRAHPLDDTQRLFEQCLATSVFSDLPRRPEFGYRREEAQVLHDLMRFNHHQNFISNFTSGVNKHANQLQQIEKEIERARECVMTRKEYTPQKLFNGALTEASNILNNRMLGEYYKSIKSANKVYLSQGEQLAQYIDPIVQKVRSMQHTALIQSSMGFSAMIRERRNANKSSSPISPKSHL